MTDIEAIAADGPWHFIVIAYSVTHSVLHLGLHKGVLSQYCDL